MYAAPVEVAVTLVRDSQGRALMARRGARQKSPGYWELPGGKLEPGESADEAARRELAEETGVLATELRPRARYVYEYPTRRVFLHLFEATQWRGEPHGREGQGVAWVDPDAPQVTPVLPSVARVLTALSLPPSVEIVDTTTPDALARAHSALGAGAKLLQLRGTRLAPDQRVAIARRIGAMARGAGAKVLLAGTPGEAARAGVEGVHSDAAAFASMRARPPLTLWSVALRDPADAARAAELGADIALVPPQTSPPAPDFRLAVYALEAPTLARRMNAAA